jgi:hypothetical protein
VKILSDIQYRYIVEGFSTSGVDSNIRVINSTPGPRSNFLEFEARGTNKEILAQAVTFLVVRAKVDTSTILENLVLSLNKQTVRITELEKLLKEKGHKK